MVKREWAVKRISTRKLYGRQPESFLGTMVPCEKGPKYKTSATVLSYKAFSLLLTPFSHRIDREGVE